MLPAGGKGSVGAPLAGAGISCTSRSKPELPPRFRNLSAGEQGRALRVAVESAIVALFVSEARLRCGFWLSDVFPVEACGWRFRPMRLPLAQFCGRYVFAGMAASRGGGMRVLIATLPRPPACRGRPRGWGCRACHGGGRSTPRGPVAHWLRVRCAGVGALRRPLGSHAILGHGGSSGGGGGVASNGRCFLPWVAVCRLQAVDAACGCSSSVLVPWLTCHSGKPGRRQEEDAQGGGGGLLLLRRSPPSPAARVSCVPPRPTALVSWALGCRRRGLNNPTPHVLAS